jgi:hypothetical protein
MGVAPLAEAQKTATLRIIKTRISSAAKKNATEKEGEADRGFVQAIGLEVWGGLRLYRSFVTGF